MRCFDKLPDDGGIKDVYVGVVRSDRNGVIAVGIRKGGAYATHLVSHRSVYRQRIGVGGVFVVGVEKEKTGEITGIVQKLSPREA